ncbi:MAG: redoxin domain-containing protein [Chloroflexota bacterium]
MSALLIACSPQLSGTEASAATTPSTVETPIPTVPASVPMIELVDAGPAPEITNDTWINSDEPLTLDSQRGKVVLLEFWTFGCINCRRVIPYVRQWHDSYAGDNFQVISIHYPEFAYEREYDNVVEATQQFEIAYPVALDNEGRTWRAYSQRYWPTTYLIDKEGHIRYKHIGEFHEQSAAEAEAAIQTLLAEITTN